MSDVKRYELEDGHVFESHDGDFVPSTDYDRLEAENKALQAEITDQALIAASEARRALAAEHELESLRSKLVVVPDEREAFEARFKNCCFKKDHDGIYLDACIRSAWNAWQARASLNGKTVSEKLLRALLDGDSNVSCVAANELRAILAE